MANTIKSKTNDPVETLTSFIKSLDDFIKYSIENIKKMQNEHNQMAYSWTGDQYNQLTNVLKATIRDATVELKELNNLKKELEKRREFLIAARSVKYDK